MRDTMMGIEVPSKWLSKKGFRDFKGFKISKSEALKNGFSPDCPPP